ncbi:MAG: phosphatase PAP2 family protein [Betaproteobacteria bacterium]|nr:MAG: phosphatase PAP2 family protein [Betaproteobacteria bacterium]
MHVSAVALESLLAWDRRWTRRLNAGIGVAPVRVMLRLVSRLGDGVFWYAVMLVLSVTQGRPGLEIALRMLAAGMIGLVVYKLLKSRTTRPRPYQVLGDIRAGIDPLDAFSFPSGHTLHAVAFTLVAVSRFPALAWVLVPFTLLVALSRVVLGLHYPSDVLAGAAIGALVALAVPAL